MNEKNLGQDKPDKQRWFSKTVWTRVEGNLKHYSLVPKGNLRKSQAFSSFSSLQSKFSLHVSWYSGQYRSLRRKTNIT